MLRNYIKIAFRNLWRNKIYSALNISGLAIGTAVCLLILLFVNHELSFDRFHSKNDRIVRLYERTTLAGVESQLQASTMYPMGPTFTEEYPEIENYVRFILFKDLLVKQKEGFVYLDKVYMADSTLLDVFDFSFINGDPNTALHKPNSVVLTRSLADRLFREKNPIGQTIVCMEDGRWICEVTGVIEDIPNNSHIQCEAFFSLSSMRPFLAPHQTDWKTVNNWIFTYLLLSKDASITKLEADFPNLLNKYAQEDFNDNFQLYLQPLTQIHLDSRDMTRDFMNDYKFDRGYLYVFLGLAVLVLLLASINFINLSTARSVTRAKEIGIRKTIGAYRWQLINQLVGEAIFYAFIAMFLAVLLVDLCLPYLSNLTQRDIPFNPLSNPYLFLMLIGMGFLVGIISGIYPALYISAYKPVKVLKGKLYSTRSKFSLRNVLVISQFTIAISLIISTILVVQQLNYLFSKNVGYNKDQVVLVNLGNLGDREDIRDKYEVMKAELSQSPHILEVTMANRSLGNRFNQVNCVYKGDSAAQDISPYILNVDYNYLAFYDIEIIAGRSFAKDRDQGKAFIINESLARSMGVSAEEIVGDQFGFSWVEELGTIIGVTKDFNHNSLHHSVEPLAIFTNDSWDYREISIRLSEQNIAGGLELVQEQWQAQFPGIPMEYKFMDEHLEVVYENEKRISEIVSIFTILAILVACLGLFGLAAFTTQQRTKEIGIRKVLGATIQNILALMLKDFVQLVFIAIVLACPIAYWLIRQWLQSFAFRIDIRVDVFIIAGLAALSIATMTVLYHAARSAYTNPVEVLRNE